jgi:ABC-type uncharacterized transport system ATPase subunit
VILVTHKLREIMAITDRVTVMRQGAVVHETATKDTSPRALAEQMVGRAVLLRVEKGPAKPGEVLLDVRDLEVRDRFGVARVKGATFALRAGEIVGIAGVSGNGQTELVEALAGISEIAVGEILLGGGTSPRTRRGPASRRSLGDRPCARGPPEDGRRGQLLGGGQCDPGLPGEAAVQQGRPPEARGDPGDCEAKMASYDVRPPSPGQRITAFSGGNQQKLVLAREIDCNPSVLIVGQPTRGVDIGAIEFIHSRIVEPPGCGQGGPRRLRRAGRDHGTCPTGSWSWPGARSSARSRAGATEEAIGLLMAGVKGEPRQVSPAEAPPRGPSTASFR